MPAPRSRLEHRRSEVALIGLDGEPGGPGGSLVLLFDPSAVVGQEPKPLGRYGGMLEPSGFAVQFFIVTFLDQILLVGDVTGNPILFLLVCKVFRLAGIFSPERLELKVFHVSSKR